MGIVRDLYYARKMSAGLKLPAPTVALLIKRLRLAAAMGGGVTKTVSGSPAHITDALAKAALSVLASIEPIQDLHGYDSPWPAGGGKNLFNPDETTDGKYIGSSGSIGDDVSSMISEYIPVTDGEKYTWSFVTNYSQGSSYANGNRRMHGYKSDGTWKQQLTYYNVTGSEAQQYTLTATIPSGVAFVRLSGKKTDENIQFEHSDNATSYAPYSNICPITGRTGLSVYVGPTTAQADATTYAVDWTSEAGTVYGGTLDVVTGVLTVERAYIASYNGETITEPWISSMDAYVSGGTPTTGAQVVYTLATPLTYQLTAQEVQMLLGENYVWSSSGDTVSVTYYAEGNANPLQSLNILLGGNYSNPKTADDVSDKEALEIILGGNK